MRVTRARFDELAQEAFADVPEEFRALLVNVVVAARNLPGGEAGTWRGSSTLLGLYSGLTRDQMLSPNSGTYMPARVFLYQRNLERGCASETALAARIRTTLRHELAHHFGFSDDDLREKWPEGASS